ncbi:acyl-CoA synthetase [Tomitella gaofuii]|uniref:acyl-CoA synthetase n=1 Tax=Tomitella gaofuii TaxID=2760083 RepID=UPI0015FA5B9F|nr:long-chain fatty acid--CoA ligase [Tomitella gaofuii]
MNLGIHLTRSAAYWPVAEALVCGEQRRTFDELERNCRRLASALVARGLGRGAAVGTYADNRAELVEVEFALYKCGAVRVPVNARLGAEELAHVLGDAGVRLLVVDAVHVDTARRAVADAGLDCTVVELGGQYEALLAEGEADAAVAVDVDAGDPCVLNFTSGSTGRLKAAVQTQGNRLANMRKRLMNPDERPGPGDRYLAGGPITHASGMTILATLSRGSAVVVLPRWDAGGFLRTVERERITSAFVVPTMLTMLLDHPDLHAADLSSLRTIGVGGAPVSPTRLREAVRAFGPIVMQGYGLGETTSGITVLTRDDVARGAAAATPEDEELLRSCGRPMFDTEVRVVGDDGAPLPPGEIGEITARGPDCVREYFRAPDLTAETFRGGWVHTGDLGYFRKDGYLFIVDRVKDMIVSGGFNIYCSEVETALSSHPAVADVCVVGVPDDTWGEAVKAVVVRRAGATATEDALVAHCAEHLARIKKPRSVDFVDALPVNRNGKTDRKAVRERYWAGAGRRVH